MVQAAGLVGLARCGDGVPEQPLQAFAQCPGPFGVLQPQRCAVGDHGDAAAGTQQRSDGPEQRVAVHEVDGDGHGQRTDRPVAE